jgi:hypothetical protein
MTDHTPDLSWIYCEGDLGTQQMYQIQVGNDNEWTAAELWDYGPITGSETQATYAGGELLDGQTYYLRVRVNDGSSWSYWYYDQFCMNSIPAAPLDLSPDNLQEVENGTPILIHANATDGENDILTYSYEVYDDDQMTSLVVQMQNHPEEPGPTTSWMVTPELPDGEDYFWRVRANDGYEDGTWSELASFKVKRGYVCGDANGDDEVNVGDAVHIINYVFKGGAPPDPVEAGDANCDDLCNVGDAVYLISYIFRGGSQPCADCP